MSQYTAPHRATSKRSLSRRTRIILLASLLVPTSLVAIAKAPVHADASNNPIFATMQDMQNAINAALAPINSAIASLQEQQQTQAQQISNLQNAPSKSLKAYDANGQELGIVIDHTGNQTTVYSTTLQRIVYLNINSTNITINGNLLSNISAYFQSNNCTGTPYALADGSNPYVLTADSAITSNLAAVDLHDLLAVDPQHFYIVPDSETPTTITANSQLYYTGAAGGCFTGPINNQPSPKAYALQQVNLPFTLPLALPLHFKYQ